MTSLTERLRQHAQLHQQCTVQDDEQVMFAQDLLAATAEIERLRDERALLRTVVESAAAADELLENPTAIFRLARIARAALGATE